MMNIVQIQQELADIQRRLSMLSGEIGSIYRNFPEAARVEEDRLLAIIDDLYKQLAAAKAGH